MLIPAVILAPRLVRLNPLTDIIFITSTKPQQRATVMSLSRTIWGILNLFAPMTAAIIVASSGGINAEGIRPLYYIQLSLVLVVFGFIALKLQPLPHSIDRRTEKATSKRGMRAFIQDFRELFKGEKALKRWIMLRVIRQFGNSLSTSFTALWLVDMKGATPYILGIMSTASVLITMLLQIPAGRLSDKIGRKKAYFLLRPIAYLGTVLLILAPHPEYLILVGLLGAVGMPGGGGIGGVGNTAFITMHWEMVPREKRGRWYGVEGLMNVATIPAAIIGGILWQQGFMTAVLLLPIVIEALVVIPIMITVPDTLGRSDR
jgi:MFS family permease